MHIALVNSFPNLPHTAEIEYIARFQRAAAQLGHTAYEVVTSDDIHACEPDFVIATHDFTPKLTPYLTLGTMWNPPHFFERSEDRVKSVLSYDGYLIGSQPVRKFIEDLEFSLGLAKPKSDFAFLPVAPERGLPPPGDPRWDLVYVGAHWDGQRHGGLLSLLDQSGVLNVYGPETSWTHCPGSYRGRIPFDGEAIFRVLSQHGIALCLHKEEHRRADTPSSRLFEAAAAGCVLISDEIPFARRVLGDSAFFVDLSASSEEAFRTILAHVDWIRANPGRATAMAAASRSIMAREYGLQRSVERCCGFARSIIEQRREATRSSLIALDSPGPADPANAGPAVTIKKSEVADIDLILRAGQACRASVRRSLRAVADQEEGRLRVLLMDDTGRNDLKELAAAETLPHMRVEYVRASVDGPRSSILWHGLRAVEAPLFALLDAHHTTMAGHLPSLLRLAAKNPQQAFFYSGVVRVQEDGAFVQRPNFDGPLNAVIPERRSLQHLDVHDIERLIAFDPYLRPNGWIARTTLLDGQILDDPRMEVGEELYLYLLLASRTDFVCSFSPTAYWNAGPDDLAHPLAQERWAAARRILTTRLRHLRFPAGCTPNERWTRLAP